MNIIYVEKAVKNHPRTKKILQRFLNKTIIECEHYGEIFNIKAQNFRLQKQKPALILAQKENNKVLPTPEGFGIGGEQNFYFSHMLNCVYDCRYCFLQGMYHSANYVLFVNYEDFQSAILQKLMDVESKAYFFSGYDCDSLAYEPVTGFVENFIPFFAEYPKAILELRTKSTNTKSLLKFTPIPNCVVAFSFTPEDISREVEHKVPEVAKRISAMQTLAQKGWQVGLRLDPLIYKKDFEAQYEQLIEAVFADLPKASLHSVSVGPMRFPVKMYQKVVKLYPESQLLSQPMEKRDNTMSYDAQLEHNMKAFVLKKLAKHMDEALIFQCNAL